LKRAGLGLLVLGQLDSTERLAHFLIEIDALYRERQVARSPLSLFMNRNQIADYLGLRIETVSRAFGRLRKLGVIQLTGNDEIVICDHAKLREIGKV
jgi:CRP-like cAMP-binding protein